MPTGSGGGGGRGGTKLCLAVGVIYALSHFCAYLMAGEGQRRLSVEQK